MAISMRFWRSRETDDELTYQGRYDPSGPDVTLTFRKDATDDDAMASLPPDANSLTRMVAARILLARRRGDGAWPRSGGQQS